MINKICDTCKKITLFYLRIFKIYFYRCSTCKSEFTTFNQLSNIVVTYCKNCKEDRDLIFMKSVTFTHLCSECRNFAVFKLNEDSNLKKYTDQQITKILNSVRY